MFLIGVIIILSGVILVSYSNKSEETSTWSIVAYEDNKWNVSTVLQKSDLFRVNVLTPLEWAEGQFEAGPLESTGILYSAVNISDPEGDATMFVVEWIISSQAPTRQLTIWNISVASEGDGLNLVFLAHGTQTENPESGIYLLGGVTTKSGLYNATVYGIYPAREEPPSRLEIAKNIKVTKYPYTSLFPLGTGIGAVGVITSFLGVRSGKQKKIVKIKRISSLERRKALA